MKKLLLCASLSMIASTVFAADAVVVEDVVDVAPVFTWTGGYVGLQLGHLWGGASVTFPEDPLIYADPDPSGFIGGGYLGYSYQFDNRLVVGAEADVNYANVDGSDNLGFVGGGESSEAWTTESDWNAALRARLGFAFDRTLLYVAGGVAWSDMTIAVVRGGDPFEASDTFTGWTVGAGVEHAFTNNMIVRAEYRYSDYGTKNYGYNEIQETMATDLDYDSHDVRLGIAYKF